MENKEGTGIHIARRPAQIFALFHFPFSILLLTAGCGAPGDPVPPSPPVPAAIKDLTAHQDRKSTRLNSSHSQISYAVFCLKKKKTNNMSPLLTRSW